MYQRFYNSLINPKNLIQYRKDSLLRVLLYMLFFALLLSTRVTIDVLTYDGLPNASKEAIKQDIIDINETCVITDSELECTRAESTLMFETFTATFYTDSFDNWNPSIYSSYAYHFVIHDDVIELVISGQSVMVMTLDELNSSFQNFDFSTYESDPDLFFDTVFENVDTMMMNYKNVWGPVIIGFDLISNVIMFLLFILLSSWMLRIRFRQIKFKHLFTMSTYSSTALFVIMIIDSLYNMSFFLVILLLFVAIRQNSQLSLELHRRLTKKP